jgi:hypothetical protein
VLYSFCRTECLSFKFQLQSCLNDNEVLVHRYFVCLTQFASLTGTIFSDESLTVQYLGHLLQGVLQLVQRYRYIIKLNSVLGLDQTSSSPKTWSNLILS